MSERIRILDQISDYVDTVHAILGFVNFYRFDDERRRSRHDVVVFQGRRLTRTSDPIKAETPDFGIVSSQGDAVVGEAKKSFPRDKTYWMGTFKQLMAYDDDLLGWPTSSQTVSSHDIVLLTHLTRVVDVCDFYDERVAEHDIQFSRPFAITSFVESRERQDYVHFEKRLGQLSHQALDERLHRGQSVPMRVFVQEYSTVMLYDTEPPRAYMAFLIWEHVVVRRASEDPGYRKLRRNQKLGVELTIDEIVSELHQGFSFHTLQPDETEREPLVPKKAWCTRACDLLVSGELAAWHDAPKKETITVHFRKLDAVLECMVDLSVETPGPPESQLGLFGEGDDSDSEGSSE